MIFHVKIRHDENTKKFFLMKLSGRQPINKLIKDKGLTIALVSVDLRGVSSKNETGFVNTSMADRNMAEHQVDRVPDEKTTILCRTIEETHGYIDGVTVLKALIPKLTNNGHFIERGHVHSYDERK